MPLSYDPLARKENTVIFGNARFTMLTSQMIRLEFASDNAFEDRPTFKVINRRTPAVTYAHAFSGKELMIKTADLTLTYRDNGKPFSKANLSIVLRGSGVATTWTPGTKDTGNLHGSLRTLDGMKGDKLVTSWEHPYEFKNKAPFQPGLLSRDGWSIVDDSDSIVLDTLPDGRKWVARREPGVRNDWYFLGHGRDYKKALGEAQDIFGRQPLPPRYTLGYWWSRYWAYTDVEIERLVASLDRMDIPLDVLVVDMDWHLNGWTGYTWDKNYFPDHEDFLRWAKSKQLKLTLNLHPAEGVGKHEEQFEAMAKAMKLDPKKVANVPFDCTDPAYMDAYFKLLHHPHEAKGIDFWWMDWQQGQTSKLDGLDPLVWLNYLHWNDLEKRNPAIRPVIFSRFSGIGSGRNPIGFSGDTFISWESLAFQPYFTATAANVLFGYWSHDIGGHMFEPNAKLDSELYLRWLQFGCYSPVLRTHATKDPANDRRFWLYGEPYTSLMIDAVKRRYELVPYIYTENRKCMDSGISLSHPLYYEYPEAAEAYEYTNQYFFGEKLIVAPVVSAADTTNRLAATNVWLPSGTWIDTSTGDRLSGGKHSRRYAVTETPVFVRPGTVICGQTDARRLEPGSYKNLLVTAYPGADGSYSLYEDDGVSQGYQTGECAWITIDYRTKKNRRIVTIRPAKGTYKGFSDKRNIEIRLPIAPPPLTVHVGQQGVRWTHRPKANAWHYDGDETSTVIRLSDVNVRKGLTIELRDDPRIRASEAYGVKGILTRMGVALEESLGIGSCSVDRTVAGLSQTGNRLARNPASFTEEIRGLRAGLKKLPAACAVMVRDKVKEKWHTAKQVASTHVVTAIAKATVQDFA